MALAPVPNFPERTPQDFEQKNVPQDPSRHRGSLRFEEGIATDTDVPNEFALGAGDGVSAPGRPNHPRVWADKSPAETTGERAHVGSAAWVDAPDVLNEFADGAFTDYDRPQFTEKVVSGTHQQRSSPERVTD